MAKLQEEIIIIKISTLLPDSADTNPIMDDESIAALEQVIQDIAGDGAKTLVEIERA